jgi:hypothetical protein
MNDFTFVMPDKQANNVHKVVASHIAALKNYIASAAEDGKLERAKRYVAELREYEALFAAFNVTAKYEIAEFSKKPVERTIQVKDRNR